MKLLKLGQIKVDKKYYPRMKWSWQTSYDYAKSMEAGAEFPPIEVARINGAYYLIDGKHRMEAMKMNKQTHIQAIVNEGVNGFKELYLKAIETNISHGRQLSVQDRVQIYIRLKEMDFKQEEISQIIRVPLEKIEKFIVTKVTKTTIGEPIALKAPLKNLAGVTVPENFERIQSCFSTQSQISILDQLIELLENGYLESSNLDVKRRVKKIKTLIKRF